MARLTDDQRFWPRVREDRSGCWLWIGGIRSNGYGMFSTRADDGRWTKTTASRYAYVRLVGSIPAGFEVDHLCRVRHCVNPAHLEAVSIQENRRRRDVGTVLPFREPVPFPLVTLPPPKPAPTPKQPRTHCKRGHEVAVVGVVRNGRNMTCAECRRIQNAARRRGGQHGTETACPQGHPYAGDNVLWRRRPNGSTGRECRTCVRARLRAAYWRRKESL